MIVPEKRLDMHWQWVLGLGVWDFGNAEEAGILQPLFVTRLPPQTSNRLNSPPPPPNPRREGPREYNSHGAGRSGMGLLMANHCFQWTVHGFPT